MFRTDDTSIDLIDEMIVDSDYVVVSGNSGRYNFKGHDESLGLPLLHVLKASKENPLRLHSQNGSHLSVSPANFMKLVDEGLTPAKIYDDKTNWNIFTFSYVPWEVSEAGSWEVSSLEKSFYQSGSNNALNGTLLFSDGQIQTQDYSMQACHVMPSQVRPTLWNWFVHGRSIYASEGEIGMMKVEPSDEFRKQLVGLVKRMEEAYGENLVHEDSRKRHSETRS